MLCISIPDTPGRDGISSAPKGSSQSGCRLSGLSCYQLCSSFTSLRKGDADTK